MAGIIKKDLLEEVSVSWTSGQEEERLRDRSERCRLRTVTLSLAAREDHWELCFSAKPYPREILS